MHAAVALLTLAALPESAAMARQRARHRQDNTCSSLDAPLAESRTASSGALIVSPALHTPG